jgi:hypothetical protein
MTQAKCGTFDEQESEKDVQQREQAVTRAQGYARSAVWNPSVKKIQTLNSFSLSLITTLSVDVNS